MPEGASRRVVLGGALTLAAACATSIPVNNIAVSEHDLWPAAPPGGEGVTVTETIIERSTDPTKHDRAVTGVRRPRVKVFRPASPNGAALLIAPGGGYQRVVLDKEGDETALRLAQAGITSAVLIYRLPGDGWAAGRDAPLQDAQRAIRLLRSGKLTQGAVPRWAGVLGFSAGGNLAARLALENAPSAYVPLDAADGVSTRPDFAALLYAAYLDGQSSTALQRGAGPPPDLIARTNASAPPTFLAHAADDRTVQVSGSIRMFDALKAAGVPAELHFFEKGGHGFGIAGAGSLPAAAWPDLLLTWMRTHGIV